MPYQPLDGDFLRTKIFQVVNGNSRYQSFPGISASHSRSPFPNAFFWDPVISFLDIHRTKTYKFDKNVGLNFVPPR